MNTAIYVRVSTDQQAEKGYSIDTQLEACRKYALELGATDIEEFVDDGYSGEFIDRPALSKMREQLVQKKFDLVIAYAPDRLARKTIHLLILSEEISKAGAERKFASVNFEATSEGELMYKFQGIVAEYEKEKIKERTMRGKRGKAAKGLVISNTHPFGYIFDQERNTYNINESEAKIIKLIFDFIVQEKMGTARVCKELNARGIPSPRGKRTWIVSSIHRILTNTLYKGIIYSMKYKYEKIGLNKRKRTLRPEGEWIPIKVPPIIDQVTWQAAQKQLQENKTCAKRNLKHDHLLNGLVVCAKCGRDMVISYSGSKEAISYYTCLSQRSSSYKNSGKQPCNARHVPTKLLDTYIFDYFLDLYYNPAKTTEYVKIMFENKNGQKNKTVLNQILKTEIELLQQKNTILRWFRQQILSEVEVERQLKDLHRQLVHIDQIKEKYEAELATDLSIPLLEEVVSTMRQNFDKANYFTIEEKRTALQAIIHQVIVERVDYTRGRGSRPEIHIQVNLK